MSKRKNNLFDNKTQTRSSRSEESRAKNMTYYDVLGVPQNASLYEIKKQFRKLAVRYHPDQKDTGDASIFALVARAYECLSDDNKRAEYDRKLSIERKARKSDYINQKKAFEEFIKAQENDITNKGIEHAKSKFRIDWEDMDRRKGIKTFGKLDDKNLGQLEEKSLSASDALKRLKDMEMEREQEEIEFTQPEIFAEGTFDKEKFNALFELKYKRDKDDQLIKHNGMPSAFNDILTSSFISCENEENYNDMFDESGDYSGNDMFGSINDTGKQVRISKDDLDKIKGFKTNYNSHNVVNKDYKNDIEKRLREREMEDKMYESRKMQDFDTDKTMAGYGFLHQVGITGKELDWDKEEIDESTFKKLIAYRQSEDREIRQKMKKY